MERGTFQAAEQAAKQGDPVAVARLVVGQVWCRGGPGRTPKAKAHAAGGRAAMGAFVIVDGQAELLEVVLALGSPGGLAGLLNGGEQEGDQDRDDGDDDQELNEREGMTARGAGHDGHHDAGQGSSSDTIVNSVRNV